MEAELKEWHTWSPQQYPMPGMGPFFDSSITKYLQLEQLAMAILKRKQLIGEELRKDELHRLDARERLSKIQMLELKVKSKEKDVLPPPKFEMPLEEWLAWHSWNPQHGDLPKMMPFMEQSINKYLQFEQLAMAILERKRSVSEELRRAEMHKLDVKEKQLKIQLLKHELRNKGQIATSPCKSS